MGDFLDILAATAKKNIDSGYYDVESKIQRTVVAKASLKDAIKKCRKNAVISEIKFSSPSSGVLRKRRNVKTLSKEMVEAGAVGISVLTEPSYFSGSLENLAEVRLSIHAPLLMKDIILSRCQIDVAHNLGADSILLILSLFERGYCESDINEMIGYAHSKGLEVLLETHTAEEFRKALSTNAEMIGINNRDLRTLKVNLYTTKKILEKFGRAEIDDKIVVSESGIKSPEDILLLRKCGVHAFLVGSSIMRSNNIKDFIARLVNAHEQV